MQDTPPVFIETMRVENGQIALLKHHAERLLFGVYQMGVPVNSADLCDRFLRATSLFACELKGMHRLRCEITIRNAFPEFSFSTAPYLHQNKILNIGVYHHEVKMNAAPWNAKTTDRGIYEAAQQYAHERSWDDALVFNHKGFLADAGIYSVFVLKQGYLYTPPAIDMPVRSVFKQWCMEHSVFPVIESSLTLEDVRNADLLMACNAVRYCQIARLVE
jgi:branched-subunit amino acid aminotransferase/4-amino-4-deoxychorismate lyase